jgi:flagellar biogenesis protein FliO
MEPIRQLEAVLFVLTLLGAAVYGLRNKGIGTILRRSSAGARQRQLESIDRLPLTPHHSLHLVRVEGRTVLIAVSPGGCSMVDRGAENPFMEAAFAQGGQIR